MRIRLDPLDELFSEFIRKRAIKRVGGCERCLAPKTDYKQLQCSHFFGRAKKSVRWDEDNAVALCMGCHAYFTAHPLEHIEWFKARLGDKFNLLRARARTPARYIDKEAIRLYLKAKIKELEEVEE